MATRRMGDALLDHGAQFFTARSDWFVDRVDQWVGAGVVREWCRGFRIPPDGHPRYVGSTGMTAVAKELAGTGSAGDDGGPDVRTSTRVTAIRRTATGWTAMRRADPPAWDVMLEGGDVLTARAVLMTPPVPQTLDVLAAGGTEPDPGAARALRAIRYSPTLAALVVADGPTAVPAPGGCQLEDGPLSWVGDNLAKGISPRPAVTLHASPDESTRRYDDPAGDTLAALMAAGDPYLGGAAVVEAQLMRWRYAQPTASHDERHLVAVGGPAPLICAGDAFGEAKVEGAARSGWSAAGALLDRLA
jgi:predicted NAD/FAD-dependent oxidoreductase